jgi:protein-arginine kinase activator protein McsA
MPTCDKCRARPATVFSTTITHGVKHQDNLCQECYDSTAPREQVEHLAALLAAHCRYCGGQPCTGGAMSSLFQHLSGGQPEGFMCVPCSMEHLRHMQALMAEVPKPRASSEVEIVQWFQILREKAEAHMQEYLASMKVAHCRYCGGQPCVGAMDYLFQHRTGTRPEGFMCVPCSQEYERYLRELAEKTPRAGAAGDWMNGIPALQEKLEAHMKQRSSDRGAKG